MGRGEEEKNMKGSTRRGNPRKEIDKSPPCCGGV
jgi:hypothetical protein